MKFNKYKLSHYFIFIASLIILLFVLPIKLFQKKNNKNIVLLYGHKLYGNLKSIYEKRDKINSDVYYLTLDKEYYNLLKSKKINLLYGLNPKDVIKIVNCNIFICDHGLHFYKILINFKKIVFIDTNHGIPYHKDALQEVNYFAKFDEVWVMSEYHKSLYEKFNYSGRNINITGYGRLDNLIQFTNKNLTEKNQIINDLKAKYNLNFKKIVLLAPTWVHNQKIYEDKKYPYNKLQFFEELSSIAFKEDFLLIYRPHMNDYISEEVKNYISNSKNLVLKEFFNFTNTEDFMKLSDILITDWSSIALDFIVLDRPVLFLDVPNPFKHGVQDDAMFRFGEIVSQNLLKDKISNYLNYPDLYFQNNKDQIEVKNKFHDIGLDGLSTDRYVKILNKYLS